MHLSFHPLRVTAREQLAEDAVSLTLEVPVALRDEYRSVPGQHVALRATIGGHELRRTYSLVSPPGGAELRLGIRVQPAGGLSHHLAHALHVGETVDVLGPTGRFIRAPEPGAERHCLAIAAGSGITPVLAIVRALLDHEPGSHVTLIYGNRTTARAMFLEELLALKNRHLDRFAVHFIMSREPQEVELFNGRLDAAKIRALADVLFSPQALDEVYVCGPGDIVTTVRDALTALGVRAPIHSERFTSTTAAAATAHTATAAAEPTAATITVVQDGRRRNFAMLESDASVLDAAERAGLELPFSCRSGVCSTCRAKVVRGSVTMAHNVALEDWELAAGYVLCCQSRPATTELELTYDEK